MRAIPALLFATFLALTGCVEQNVAAPPAAAVQPGQTAITITRSTSPMYFGAPATVEVNGAQVAGLGVGQSWAGPVTPGTVTITVSAWSAPGHSSFRFTAEPGKQYRFVVAPRAEQTAAGALGGILGQSIEGGGPFKVVPAG